LAVSVIKVATPKAKTRAFKTDENERKNLKISHVVFLCFSKACEAGVFKITA